jgi:LPS-assembly lipoprotein
MKNSLAHKHNPLAALLACMMLCSLLTSCGFHLRGSAAANIEPIERFALENTKQRYSGVALELEQLAISQKIAIDPQAPWSVRLQNEQTEQWRASTSHDYSKNEYWLSLSVDLIITNQTVEYQAISLKRQALFQDDKDQLNSKAIERETILQELRRQLAQQALQKLAYLINNPPNCDCDED